MLIAMQERLAALLEERKKMGEVIPEQSGWRPTTKGGHWVHCPISIMHQYMPPCPLTMACALLLCTRTQDDWAQDVLF